MSEINQNPDDVREGGGEVQESVETTNHEAERSSSSSHSNEQTDSGSNNIAGGSSGQGQDAPKDEGYGAASKSAPSAYGAEVSGGSGGSGGGGGGSSYGSSNQSSYGSSNQSSAESRPTTERRPEISRRQGDWDVSSDCAISFFLNQVFKWLLLVMTAFKQADTMY